MTDAIAFVHRTLGVSAEETLRMATLYPAETLGAPRLGRIERACPANLVHLADDLQLRGTMIAETRPQMGSPAH